MSDADRKLLADAADAWRVTRSATNEQERFDLLLAQEGGHPLDDAYGQSAAWRQVLARWADGGYGWLRTTQTYAAALICSDTSTLARADIETTWQTILVELPAELFSGYDRLLVDFGHDWRFDDEDPSDAAVHLILFRSTDHTDRRDRMPATLASILGIEAVGDVDLALFQAAARLAMGLLMTVQFTDNFRTGKHPAARASGPWARGTPAHRVVIVGRELTTDFSEEVRAFVTGRRAGIPSVQSVVRGHYKRQVIGVGRAGRKVIWIQPYWRGPEDAPILARPYSVGSDT
jgi:hypothetical protein